MNFSALKNPQKNQSQGSIFWCKPNLESDVIRQKGGECQVAPPKERPVREEPEAVLHLGIAFCAILFPMRVATGPPGGVVDVLPILVPVAQREVLASHRE